MTDVGTQSDAEPTDRPMVAVLDYGIGNVHSAQKAIERGGAECTLPMP